MSVIKADRLEALSGIDTDLVLDGKGTGTVDLPADFKVGGQDNSTALGGGPSLGTDSIIRTNATNIAEDITIPVGTNGMSAGPITIDTGFTVTVNGTWTIVGS